MQVGGFRRLYIPGDLSFPLGLKAAAGRPSVPAKSPVMFDLRLLSVPGALLTGPVPHGWKLGGSLHLSGISDCAM